ncbi:MAG: diguanylate cyclase, partial [Thalassospira sp.]|nr:diguanylate cyclase [Thalassospira sp.]
LGVAVVKGASVAVLADDNLTQMSLKRILEKDQHRITPFGTVEELQEGIPGGNFDILIVPLRLKGEDMLRSCVALRNNEKSRQLPILLMAEEEDEPILAKALELGLNDYILRPIDQHELRARVATQVRRLRYQERLRNTYEMSINLALTDELTGLYNRRYFNAHLDSLLAQAEKEHKSTTVLILDIDFFKKINDTYGHDEGDKVLVDVAKRLMRSVRDADLVARLGGEEFVAVLPDTRTGIGLQVAERLRRSMEGTPFSLLSGQEIPVTISIGMACTRNEADLDRHRMLKVADEALYKAKRSGRNRVVVGSFAATSVASMGKDKAVS